VRYSKAHTSHQTPHTSNLTPHTSHLTPHTSHLTPHTSHLTPHTSHTTPHRYAHPLESLFGNVFPALFGPLLMRASVHVWCVWITLRMLKTCDAHSGSYTSHVTCRLLHFTRHTSLVNYCISHVTRHLSIVAFHTSHVTCRLLHFTRHTSHVTRFQDIRCPGLHSGGGL
jgi:hypothetical protein